MILYIKNFLKPIISVKKKIIFFFGVLSFYKIKFEFFEVFFSVYNGLIYLGFSFK